MITEKSNHSSPKVSIIILNWNGRDDTLECLASIVQLDYSNYEVVVVDNGSMDDSVSSIQKMFPDVTLIQTHKNLGYAGGNNVGIKRALETGAEYILILNNDTVVDSSLLRKLFEANRTRPDAGLLGPAIYNYSAQDELISIGGVRDPSRSFEFVQASHEGSAYQEVEILIGCAMLIKREVFERAGLLDESFFLCWEEIDFCMRAAENGFKCLAVPEAVIWHKVGAALGAEASASEEASPLRTYFDVRNQLRWAKHHLNVTGQRALLRERLLEAKQILLPKFHVGGGNDVFYKRLYWSIQSYLKMVRDNMHSPVKRAKLYALRDYLLGRFGDCPAAVRRLNTN
jgi:GT2 family glycosyltransferase